MALASCAHNPTPTHAPVAPGSKYVAMGSSFASGPGVTTSADSPPNRCQRSADNYAHQLARKRNLNLVDVSCGGATTAHILGAWNELPAQIVAITPDTALVTITIGGNDVGFVSGLMAGSCEAEPEQRSSAVATMCDRLIAYGRSAPQMQAAAQALSDEARWTKFERGFDQIAAEVRRRAPQARLVFVDYVSLVPNEGLCPVLPLSDKAATFARATALRLSQLTADTARRTGAGLVKASELSKGHDVCAENSWSTGFIPPSGAADLRSIIPISQR